MFFGFYPSSLRGLTISLWTVKCLNRNRTVCWGRCLSAIRLERLYASMKLRVELDPWGHCTGITIIAPAFLYRLISMEPILRLLWLERQHVNEKSPLACPRGALIVYGVGRCQRVPIWVAQIHRYELGLFQVLLTWTKLWFKKKTYMLL